MISPVLPEHSGQYWCVARRGGKTSEYGVSLNVLLQTSYVPPPTIKRVSGGHVTTGETLVLSCSVSVSWAVMVRLSWNLPNPAALPPRLLLPDPVSKNVSVGGTHLKVHLSNNFLCLVLNCNILCVSGGGAAAGAAQRGQGGPGQLRLPRDGPLRQQAGADNSVI